jgi:large subunit ribosomal protein L25
MKISFELVADVRNDEGKGASRRLRRAGQVPAILYGGKAAPQSLSLKHEKLMTLVENEKFYSTILGIKVGESVQPVIVKDLQMHPAKNQVLHLDLQRVFDNEKIRIRLPIHFQGESISPGVKTQGGQVSHRLTDIEVQCLPKDLPEEITLDLSQMNVNENKYLSDIPLPEGVISTIALQGRNEVVVSISNPRANEPETPAGAEAAAPAAKAAGAK